MLRWFWWQIVVCEVVSELKKIIKKICTLQNMKSLYQSMRIYIGNVCAKFQSSTFADNDSLPGTSHAYLGVKLDSKLSWAKHITEITTKSSKVLGMVKRTLGPCKPEVKDTAYIMLVRPKLEYASPIWNPHTSSQINRLERIQHYAARFVANDHRRTTSPTTLVQTLNWQTLERRRTIKQAMTFYKILNNIIEINPPTGLLTQSHNRHHFTIPRSRLNSVVYSFYPRAIRIWNTIPKEITEIKQPESFHAAISKLPFTTPTHLKCL